MKLGITKTTKTTCQQYDRTHHQGMKRSVGNDENLFVCLVGFFSSHSRMFYSYVNVNNTGEGLQILTYTRYSEPLSSEGSLACHANCDTLHSFTWLSQRNRDTLICCQEFISGAIATCFNDQSVVTRDRTPISCMRGESSTNSATAQMNWQLNPNQHQNNKTCKNCSLSS